MCTTDPERLVRVGILEVEVILGFLAELRGSHIHPNLNLASVSSFFNGLLQQLQTYVILNKLN